MKGYARIKISDNSVLVRFEQIDPPGTQGVFDKLRDRLYQEIPLIKWDHDIRWLVAPYHELNRVLNFCYREFGVGHVKIEGVGNIEHLKEFPLRF
jgi:hypothetical protein